MGWRGAGPFLLRPRISSIAAFQQIQLKGEPVGTTIDENVDRRGGADSGDDIDIILRNSLKILADSSRHLEQCVERLKEVERDTEDKEARKTFQETIRETTSSWRLVLYLWAKASSAKLTVAPLDLEAAREEIQSRLDRLAA